MGTSKLKKALLLPTLLYSETKQIKISFDWLGYHCHCILGRFFIWNREITYCRTVY
jgi:hypothetical protein